MRVFLELRLRNGARAAENFADVFVLPKKDRASSQPGFDLHDPLGTVPELGEKLEKAGYSSDPRGVLIASVLDDEVREHLARGGDAIVSLRTSHHQVMTSETASISPGKMPAKNSFEIETLAATPKTTKLMLGGMIGAMMPAEAIRPAERARSWPAATIIGSNRVASAAASATAEPDSAARRQAATIVT